MTTTRLIEIVERWMAAAAEAALLGRSVIEDRIRAVTGPDVTIREVRLADGRGDWPAVLVIRYESTDSAPDKDRLEAVSFVMPRNVHVENP